MTIKEYTNEIIDMVMSTLQVDPIHKYGVIKRVHSMKSFKEFHYRKLEGKKLPRKRKSPARIPFSGLSTVVQKLILLSCEKYDVDVFTFCENYRESDVMFAQRNVIYFLRNQMRYSYPKIGLIFMKDHSTIMHACKVHLDDYETDKMYRRIYNSFQEEALKIISEFSLQPKL